ncbi:C40 family peptidase [Pedococcus bigeumensis]|uniref:C40 family peptidase n=1 Tax=Pedococcus bigeumensis TaxID=433644 RepID=UPI002FECBDF6
MASQSSGRHRAPGRFNPVSELSGIVASAAQPAVKTSAVIAASGGLVASFALPASAASAAPAPAAQAATTAAPVAVRAPETAAPAASSAFGVIGFKATAKPKPKPKPKPVVRVVHTVVRSTAVASRSTVRKDYTSLKPAAGGVLAIAAQYEGLMYSYGGTSPSTGFDCSGFTQYVFGRVGISLPRTAEQQRNATTRVSNPQPGDLVFFGSPAYHVGIYAGNGMMWDSPRSGKAVALRSIWSSNVTYGRP